MATSSSSTRKNVRVDCSASHQAANAASKAGSSMGAPVFSSIHSRRRFVSAPRSPSSANRTDTPTRSGLAASWSVVGHRVDGDGDSEDQRGIDLLAENVDAVGIAHPEPFLRDFGDLVAVLLDLVLVVDDVAVRLDVRRAVDVDLELVADADHLLVHCRVAPADLERHLVADGQLLLLDGRHLASAGVLELPGVSDAQRLAVDLERLAAVGVLDPVV